MTIRKQILERDYDFTDAMLEQLANYTASNITRDMAALASHGITEATVTHLNELQEALSATPTDIEERSLVGEAVEVKDAAYVAAMIEARRLRTAAQNVFTEDSAKYRRFGFDGMDRLTEIEFRGALQRFFRVGTTLQPLLADEGIDAAFIAAFLLVIEAYIDSLDEVNIAEEARDAQTEDRVTKGNTLYKEVVRICNIGKDVFAPISEAAYNDYVIENYVGNNAFAATSLEVRGKVVVNGTTTPLVNAQVKLGTVEEPDTEFTATDENGNYRFYFNELPAHLHDRAVIHIDAPGFQQFTYEFDVETGKVFTINAALTQGMLKVA